MRGTLACLRSRLCWATLRSIQSEPRPSGCDGTALYVGRRKRLPYVRGQQVWQAEARAPREAAV
jgi:hypothetical protein